MRWTSTRIHAKWVHGEFSTLHKEIRATKKNRMWEIISPGMSTAISYPIPSGNSQKHTYESYNTDWVGYI